MDHDVPLAEMPKALIVVSDMEIDRCGDRNWMFYDHMKEKYEYCGYQLSLIHIFKRSVEQKLLFRDLKPYLQIGRHFSIVNRNDW